MPGVAKIATTPTSCMGYPKQPPIMKMNAMLPSVKGIQNKMFKKMKQTPDERRLRA
jgi:hypothetical protein